MYQQRPALLSIMITRRHEFIGKMRRGRTLHRGRGLYAIAGRPALYHSGHHHKVLDNYKKSKHGIVIPVYNGKHGHPVIFDAAYEQELLAIAIKGRR